MPILLTVGWYQFWAMTWLLFRLLPIHYWVDTGDVLAVDANYYYSYAYLLLMGTGWMDDSSSYPVVRIGVGDCCYTAC